MWNLAEGEEEKMVMGSGVHPDKWLMLKLPCVRQRRGFYRVALEMEGGVTGSGKGGRLTGCRGSHLKGGGGHGQGGWSRERGGQGWSGCRP